MHYLLSWSGGKDSTASIILAHENNEPLDTIIFCEVMYDLKNNISGENPDHIKFIKEKAKPIFESWGYKVEILRSDRDYLDFFHRIIKHPRKHMERKGKKFGFPVYGMCGVKRDLKLKPISNFLKKIDDDVMQYIGICANEKRRLESLHKQRGGISLLEKYNITEEDAWNLCNQYDLLSPCYMYSKRGGCWFCPNAKLEEHRIIKQLYPNVWEQFIALEDEENIANNKYNVFGRTLHEIDKELIGVENENKS